MTVKPWAAPDVKWSDARWSWSGTATTGPLRMSVMIDGREHNWACVHAAVRVGADRPSLVEPVPDAPSATLELDDPDGSLSESIGLAVPVVLTAVRADLADQWTRFVGEVTDNSWAGGVCSLGAVADMRRMGWSLAGGVDWPQETDAARATRIATSAGRPLTIVGTPEMQVRDRVNQDYRSSLDLLSELAKDTGARLVQQNDGTVEYQVIGYGERTPVFTVLPGARLRMAIGSRLDTDGLLNRVRLEPYQETTHLWVDAVWRHNSTTGDVASGNIWLNPAWTPDQVYISRYDAAGVDHYAQLIQLPQSISLIVDVGTGNEIRFDADARPLYIASPGYFTINADGMPDSVPWANGTPIRVRITSPYRSPWTPIDLEAVDSFDAYGPHETSQAVQLATATDATRLASATLNRWNTPTRRADELQGDLDGSDWEQLDAFLGLRVGDPAQLDVRPSEGPLTDMQYVVDGWSETWDGEDGQVIARMLLKVSRWTSGGRRWSEVTPATTWATVPAGMRWTDADTAMPGAVRLAPSRRLVEV